MAKKSYVGIDGTARRITKAYVGIGGVARRIKKAYIGVNGVARPCYSMEALEWQGKVADLSVARGWGASASTPSYALFASGSTDANSTSYSYRVDTVDAITSSYVAVRAESCLDTTIGSGISFNNKALFCGGTRHAQFVTTNTGIDIPGSSGIYYGDDLAMHILTGMYNTCGHAMTSTPTHCLIGGGIVPTTSSNTAGTLLDTVIAYDTSLTKYSATALSVARYMLGAATAGQYALFAGGSLRDSGSGTIYKYMSNAIDVYNASLTSSTLNLPGSYCCVGASGKNCALFACSSDSSINGGVLYAYSDTLTLIGTVASSYGCSVYGRTARYDNYAIIAAGTSQFTGSIYSLDFYDESMVRMDATTMFNGQMGAVYSTPRCATCMTMAKNKLLLTQCRYSGQLYTDVYAISIVN